MMWNLSRIIIAAIVCGAALLVAGFTQVLTPLEKIEQAQAIIRSITNLTPTGVTNQKNILTRLTTLKGQLVPVPAPVDAVLSDWTLSSAMVWGICQDGIQMRTETWTRTIVTPASNGGATGSLIETRTGTRARCR